MAHRDPSAAAARAGRLTAVLVAIGGLFVTFAASRVTGPAFDEIRRIEGAHRAVDLARAVSDFGPGALVSSSAEAIYDVLAPHGVLPGVLSGWLGEVFRRLGIVDRLTATRFGWLLITGLAPLWLYFIVGKSRGSRLGALSAAFLVATPRWLHGAGTARDGAVLGSIWLCLLALYVRSLPEPASGDEGKRRAAQNAVLFAVALGISTSVSFATLWVLPLIVAHFWLLHREAALRSFRAGRALVPAAFLWALLLCPGIVLATTPQLWRGNAGQTVDWLFAPLAPSVDPIEYRGAPVTLEAVPRFYGLHWFFATTPVLLLAFALGGAFLLVRGALVGRGTSRSPDPEGLGLLACVAAAAFVLGLPLTPNVLLRFPPRVEAALPLVAAASAVGFDAVATRIVGAGRRGRVEVASALALLSLCLVGLPTAGASFGLLGGGPRPPVRASAFAIGDGSEVAALAPAIDGLGAPRLAIDAPDVPRNYWAVLSGVGRLRTRVESAPQAPLAVLRGTTAGAVATVTRWGVPLWSLVRR